MNWRQQTCRLTRALLAVSVVMLLAMSIVESTHAEVNCTSGGTCDCCDIPFCAGGHSRVCPTSDHDCSHHTGTACDWTI
jgi:hypothetical protein